MPSFSPPTVSSARHRALAVLTVAAILLTLLGTGLPAPARAQSTCTDGMQASGAVYRICTPPPGAWNGDLVVFAHGYVAPGEPIGIPEDQLELGDDYLPDIITGLGYGFAMSSYSVNGLAILPGLADTVDVVQVFSQQVGVPNRVYLTGASEGGLITTLGVEQRVDVFDGGLSTCGPVGDFRQQIDYWGDVRVLFDYFFPGVIPGSAVQIPPEVMDGWEATYRPAAEAALRGDPSKTAQLLVTGRVPHNPADLESGVSAVLQVLWYNVFATNDGIAKLGGQPFDNQRRRYLGSADDLALNAGVARFAADQAALAEISRAYQTAGRLAVPQVLLHTVGDPVVPYWHQPQYRQKIIASGSAALHRIIRTPAFSHCGFAKEEVLAAFGLLVAQVTGGPLPGVEAVLTDAGELARYQELLGSYHTLK